jgi:dephospho-CoA kinase
MLKVGLTGNLGSGKSVVARIFQILGVPVYHADEASRSFLTAPVVIKKIVSAFGTGVLTSIGEIDRKALGRIVFTGQESVSLLNSILHPLVREDSRNWYSLHSDKEYIIHEAAIIFESGFREEYDRIIHVSCPEKIAVQRAMKRDRVPGEEILNRIRFQWKNEEKAELADFVIMNDGTEMLLPQVLRLHEILKKLAEQSL